MSFPVPGCRTTSLFLLSSAIGICQNPSRMSYLAKYEVDSIEGTTSHPVGNAKGAVGTMRLVPTE
eukprot:4774565-Prymnesium_polylepis.1